MLTSRYPRTLGIYTELEDALPDRFETLAEILRSHGYLTIGATANPNINSSYNFDQGFDDYVDSTALFRWMHDPEDPKSQEAPQTQDGVEIFTSLLERAPRSSDRPVYLQANIMEVHRPAGEAGYARLVRQASHLVGQFVERVRALPGWERTVFVITSDHGQGLSDHPALDRPGRTHGFHVYDSQVDVPLILFSTADDLPRGRTVDHPVRLLDLLPTLLDVLGLGIPPDLDGVSLLPVILDETHALDLPSYFVTESQFRDVDAVGVYGGAWNYFENRAPLEGTDAYELQRAASKENGAATNRIDSEPTKAAERAEFLARWEARYPKAEPSRRVQPLSDEERSQLESLGYLE